MNSMQKYYLRLSRPSLSDNTATMDRLAKGLRKETGDWPQIPVKCLMPFAETIRGADYKITATLMQSEKGGILVQVEPGNTESGPIDQKWSEVESNFPDSDWPRDGLGVALDIGSTHLQAELLELATKETLAKGTCLNPQTAVGADILTRIHSANTENGLKSLHLMLVESARGLIREMCARANRDHQEINLLVAAGNTTMTHFFLGLDVQTICREPYIPVTNRPAPFFGAEIGLGLNPRAVVWCLPNVGSYFGGDLVAGIVAADLHLREDNAILVDVGTNAEVVLGNRDWLAACAGAAGPALEGGVAKTGILAQPGAIEGITIDPKTHEPSLKIIPEPDGKIPKPKGLCGSGLLDLLAQLYLTRIMDMRGKFVLPDHKRIVETDEGLGYVVATEEETQTGEAIVFTEVEIDILLRSKAGMYTILRTVVLEVGLGFEDLSAFFVAGAFGNVIKPETAITLGMLPDLPRDRFRSLGNSSLAGCKRLLLEPETRPDVEAVSDRLTYIELNVNQALMNRFSAARFIPHTDASRFPSVPVFNK
ncbi:ASKHA domain-containing protein [Dethiosulfatarculus sandiegensis]|uniref:[Fe-S]-binding protein n=1 Tax=Dethiosulfatarculus sandiegensis TaxID=1429043 RepID=A0A0D2GA94_9BACT|nr:ASKHA domain-containing protein [Dethiosulfatarculus sandiegensis]KIX11807.1 hypothetical protein X474_22285 [Dethiosulfatarculus sandiegensis]